MENTNTLDQNEQPAVNPAEPDLAAEITRLKSENEKLRASVSNASADASKYKKQWQATLSEQERREAEIAEQRAAETAELNQLRAEKRVSGYASRLMAVGYDSDTANIMAASLPEGVSDAYFEAQRTFIENKVQATKNAMLASQPSITPGKEPSAAIGEQAEEKLRKAFGL